MSLINEAMARAHCMEQHAAAEQRRLVGQVRKARRAEKQAARSAAAGSRSATTWLTRR